MINNMLEFTLMESLCLKFQNLLKDLDTVSTFVLKFTLLQTLNFYAYETWYKFKYE